MIKHKINKYIEKMNINPKYTYANKLLHYVTIDDPISKYKMHGAGSIQYGDCNSILNFLQTKCSSVTDITKNKYFVILYGPPGSGKSLARKIACHIIKKYYNEDATVEQIEKDFVDTGIDEITYDIIEPTSHKRVRELLIENLKKQLGLEEKENVDPELYFDKIQNNPTLLKNLASSSFQIYKNNRKDSLSELLYYFAISIKKNIFIELASPQTVYLDRILALIQYYQYIPIFVYPFVSKSSILCDRAIKRGLNEGRFLECKSAFGIENAMKSCLEGYDSMKNIIRNYDKSYILQYNADFDTEIFNEISSYHFDNLEKYKLEYEYGINEKNIEIGKSLRAHYVYKDFNYDSIVTLNFDSKY